MSQTLTIRLNEELSSWLEETASRTGLSQSQIIREQLEKAKTAKTEKPFMRWAGSVHGLSRDLSRRKGYSRQLEKSKAMNGFRPFMRWAGVISGPKNLSSRKGFSEG
ncbi:MAG TPA: CopG family transcriptional regulator [Verrucomicrobiae bacterium]|nr:CopG family transcriptional regulator [Verrucomicrobiae bacterium]